MDPYVIEYPPVYDNHPLYIIVARNADGMDAVELTLRYDSRTGPAKALMLLARTALEVCVRARRPKPAQTEPGAFV